MGYTRIYPLGVRSYRPSDNSVIEQVGVTLTDASSNVTNVLASTVSLIATPAQWFCKIYSGLNLANYKAYRISAASGTTVTLLNMDGTAFSAPVGSTASNYSIRFFKNLAPTAWDLYPDAFCLSAVPTTGTATLDIITVSGGFFAIPATALVAGAVYNISIAEVVAINGAAGYLLGVDSIKGSPL